MWVWLWLDVLRNVSHVKRLLGAKVFISILRNVFWWNVSLDLSWVNQVCQARSSKTRQLSEGNPIHEWVWGYFLLLECVRGGASMNSETGRKIRMAPEAFDLWLVLVIVWSKRQYLIGQWNIMLLSNWLMGTPQWALSELVIHSSGWDPRCNENPSLCAPWGLLNLLETTV